MNFIFMRWTYVVFVLFVFESICGQSFDLPWHSFIIEDSTAVDDIHTLSAKSDVTVSDGLTYSTHAIYHDPQRAAFQLIYPDKTATQGIDGKYFWIQDGSQEHEAPPFYEEFVLGHQYFAQLLYFDRLHPELTEIVSDEFEGERCQSITGKSHLAPWKVYFENSGRPIAMELIIEGMDPIITKLENWEKTGPLKLPKKLIIDDGQRVFTYVYTEVQFNNHSLDELRLPFTKLSDEQQLLRLHRGGMDDHFFERFDELKKARDTSFYIVNRGRVDKLNAEQFDQGMSHIVTSSDHTRYDDLIRPIVKISKDGTLGWVIVRVGVEGVQINEDKTSGAPFEFISAWIELYEKKDGHWKMVGNVSNFKEP